MIEKMIEVYREFLMKYKFLPSGFVLDTKVYTELRKELRGMYPNEIREEFNVFMGLPITVCTHDCGISFQVLPTQIGQL